MDDLALLSLEAVTRAVRERRTSAEEVATACIARIEKLEPALNAFITVTADEMLAAARAVDRGERRGQVAGSVVALKDLFDTAGVRTTAGSRIFADRIPAEDAVAVARLRQEGAAFAGKTNLHEWAFGVTTQNPHFGPTRNPWDRERIPGGSSGGSAVALIAGFCHGALGSDTGGSIRIPASLCGVVGLKGTYGRISVRGVVPLSWTLDHAGPMARGVRDVAVLYRTIAGYDALDPLSVDAPAEDPLPDIERGVKGLRVAVPRGHFFERCDAEVASLVRAAIDVLAREGALIEEVPFPPSQDLLDTQRTILSTDAAAFHKDRLRERPDEIGADVRARLSGGTLAEVRLATSTGIEYAEARHRRDELRREISAIFDAHDVMAVPATAIAAPPAEGEDAVAAAAKLTALTSPFNLTGLPAISLPCGFTRAGLPVGLQLAGGAWREAMVLRVARAYERATSWTERRPALA